MVIQMVPRKKTAAEKLARQMQLLWREHRSEFVDRVERIESARASLANGLALTFAERAEAASSAHKLAGVLGMFGLKDGTEAARNIEALLTADEAHSAEHLTQQLTPNISALRAAIASR
jgi:HPt (histidine-containing phosphotransfer) domain-containing protein